MRQAATPAQRVALLRRMALVMMPSAYLRDRLLDGVGNIPRPPVIVPNCIDLIELPAPRVRENLILFAGMVVDQPGHRALGQKCAVATVRRRICQAGARRSPASTGSASTACSAWTLPSASVRAIAELLRHCADARLSAPTRRAGGQQRWPAPPSAVVPSCWLEPFGLVKRREEALARCCWPDPRRQQRGLARSRRRRQLYADPDCSEEIAAAIRSLGSATRPAVPPWRRPAAARAAKRLAGDVTLVSRGGKQWHRLSL